MNVLLITFGSPGVRQSQPDVGLGYLAGCLRRQGHGVAIRDFTVDSYEENKYVDYLTESRFHVVGFKLFSSGLQAARAVIMVTRKALPDAVLVCGGPHPSCAPRHTLQFLPEVDYACAGEGEDCLTDLVSQLERGSVAPESIPGLVYRSNNGIHTNPMKVEEDLRRFGIPAWDLIPPQKYARKQSQHLLARGRVPAPISVVRGCPFACTFCTAHTIMGRRPRYRPVDLVLDEIEMLVRGYGVDEIHIVDDFFTHDKQYVFAFCEGIEKRGLCVRWACPNGIRIETIEPGMVAAMEKAGCYLVSLGIESGSQRVLDMVRKKLRLEEVREKVAVLRKHTSMVLQGFFILGFPTETEEEMMRTIEFARELPLDMVGFTYLRLTPGAEILEQVHGEGWEDPAWEYINIERAYYHPNTISRETLIRLRRRAYVRFYSHPRRILFLLRQLRSARNLRVFSATVIRRLFPSRA